MKTKRFLWILLYILAVILPSIIYVSSSENSNVLFVLSGVLGITSYVLLAFQFLLTSRPKMIDHQFSLDRTYRFHMIIAVVAIVFAYLHKMLKEMYFSESLQTSFGDKALTAFIAISVFSILMMINKLFFRIKPIDVLRRLLNKFIKIKYQYKVLLHNLFVIALIILLIHILMAGSVSTNPALEIILLVYFVIPFALYFNHKIIKVYFNKRNKYTVSEVISESNNITTLKLKPKYGEVFHYLPGQFLYVRIQNPNIPHDEHPFTISSSPSQKDYVSVTVKQLGDFTDKLKFIKPGDSAYIDGPFGAFSYMKSEDKKKICFIAGGIGITPFLGMLRHMKDVKADKDVVLLWGVRDLSEMIYKNELDHYTSEFKKFKLVPVLSGDNTYQGEKGFINTNVIKKYIDHYLEYDFYICGPPVMLDIQIKNLRSLGVSMKNIHFERFSY